MKIAINAALVVFSVVLVYLMVETFRRPIDFDQTWKSREDVVREKLTSIAELQKMHKELTKVYADNFDSLYHVLTTDTFLMEMIVGDRYDTNQVVTTKIVPYAAKDSLKGWIKKKEMNMSIDDYFAYLRKVPFATEDMDFSMDAGEAIVEGTDSLMAPTFEVGTYIDNYMPEYDSATYVIYENSYNPNNTKRKVGDLYKPSTAGNW